MSDTERGSMTRGGNGSHWAGCEKVHWDCALDAKDAEIARLRRERDEARSDLRRFEWVVNHLRRKTTCDSTTLAYVFRICDQTVKTTDAARAAVNAAGLLEGK